jgi:hypothetical protein
MHSRLLLLFFKTYVQQRILCLAFDVSISEKAADFNALLMHGGAGAIIPKRREDLTCCRNGRGGVEQIRRPTQMTIAHPLDIYMYFDILGSVLFLTTLIW